MITRICAICAICGPLAAAHAQRPQYSAPQSLRAANSPHPNVLLVVIDDLGEDLLATSCTPTLDSLAGRGLTLANYYTPPVCSPTRAALLTGRYGMHTGIGKVIRTNISGGQVGLNPDEQTLPELLPAHASALVGKWHLSPPSPDQLLQPHVHGFEAFAGTMDSFSGNHHYYNWPRAEHGAIEVVLEYATTVTTDDALAQLAPWPWLLVVAYHAPHDPFQAPPPELLSCSPRGTDDRGLAEAMVEALDAELGRLLAAVPRDTYVFVVSDNGSARSIVQPPYDPLHAKGSVYDGGVNVPAWVYGPGVPVATVQTPVAAVDLLPTILELAGQPLPADVDGVSFAPYLSGDLTPHRQVAYVERFAPNQPPGQWQVDSWDRAVISADRWKLIRHLAGADELYDLAADPLETANLYPPQTPDQAAHYAALLAELTALGAQ